MTRRFLLTSALCLTALGLVGCSGGGSGSSNTPPTDLYGIWKLTTISGGSSSPTTPNYTEIITFRTDNTVTIQDNDNTPITGSFTSERKVTDIQSTPLLVLTLPGGIERAITDKSATSLTLAEVNTSNRHYFTYTRLLPQ